MGAAARRALLAVSMLSPLCLSAPAGPAHGSEMRPLIRSDFLTSDGVRLALHESAPMDAGAMRTVVLVPGWSMPASVWRAQAAALGVRHRVIAIDPRGQGESEVPASGYDIDRRADDLHEIVSALAANAAPVVLVGWSLGALEALQLLHRHGDAGIAALMIVDSSVGEGPPVGPSGLIEELRRDRERTLLSFVRACFRKPQPQTVIDALVASALRLPLEASVSLFPSRVPREHWRRLARGFAKPLAYAVTPQFAHQAAELRRARPATRIEVFDTAGHALFADEPARFNALLEEFAAAATRR